MTRYIASILIILFFLNINAQDPKWGKLANPGFEEEHIKSAFFFTGNWRNGVQFYDYNPTDNTGLYTIHPADARHLGWSENIDNRDFAIQTMINAGVNVINMSYWGKPGTDNWAFWAPMQTSTASHDELFDAALEKEVLICPYIESFDMTITSKEFFFAEDFPGPASNPAPVLRNIIEDLIDRYLLNPSNEEWPSKWATVYDRDGEERYLISIIHVTSNQIGVTHESFAAGFDLLANEIFGNTGIKIGFALDFIPPDTEFGFFKATPAETGPLLYQQESVIATQCFIPEIWSYLTEETAMIDWKYDFLGDWKNTGIPLIHDISSGYDAHIVFPGSPQYGNNQLWRDLQTELIDLLGSQSFTVNAWNGYTEGFAGVPTLQYGDATYNWICDLLGGNCGTSMDDLEKSHIDFVDVFPNPFSYELNILITSNEDAHVQLFSASGKQLLSEKWKVHSRAKSKSYDLSLLPNGIYILKISTENQIAVKRIIKLS